MGGAGIMGGVGTMAGADITGIIGIGAVGKFQGPRWRAFFFQVAFCHLAMVVLRNLRAVAALFLQGVVFERRNSDEDISRDSSDGVNFGFVWLGLKQSGQCCDGESKYTGRHFDKRSIQDDRFQFTGPPFWPP